MADKTEIPWTEATLNPVSGCTPVDESCKNCYARAMIHRYAGCKGWPIHEDVVTLWPERLKQLAKWKKPRMVFMPSMGDLFHKDVPFAFILKVFAAMSQARQHTYQLLTKRPRRMAAFIEHWGRVHGHIFNMKNVWLGVSIGAGQKYADERIPILLSIPAKVRFVSVEPMLDYISLELLHAGSSAGLPTGYDALSGWYSGDVDFEGEPSQHQGEHLDWVIAGCESGPKRRHISIDAFRHLRDQCVDAGVPFFLKQMEVNGKVIKMPELDGQVWNQMPE